MWLISMNESSYKNPAAVALGRLGGSRATEAQKRAARANGARGGRPKKVQQVRDDQPEVQS